MLRSGIIDGILAGVMVSIGGCVFLASEISWVGAIFFTVALLSICLFGFSLYTGKVGFLVKSHSKSDVLGTYAGLLGNVIGTVLVGLLIAAAIPALRDAAAASCAKKLTQTGIQTLIRGFFCGILMYTAVWTYREKKTIAGILFCVPVFIVSGFEHSVADMFYFALAGEFTGNSLLFIVLVLIGNSIGGAFIPFMQLLKGGKG